MLILGDFLGITAPFTIKLKLLMKKLYELDFPPSWDEDIPDKYRTGWIDLISEALTHNVLTFPRSTKVMTLDQTFTC